MRISRQFQKFFFGVVVPEIRRAKQPLKYTDEHTGETVGINFSAVKKRDVYQLLKHINPHYPKDYGYIPKSTTEIDTDDMRKHIRFIEDLLSENGHTARHIEHEWNKILHEAGIFKE